MPITPLRPWRQPHHGKLLALLVAALAAVFLWQVILLVTEWFWFTEVGYTHVFRISLLTRAGAGLVLGVVFFLLTWGNLKIALHVTARMGRTPPEAVMPLPLPQFEGVRLQRTVIVLCLVMVFFAGLRGTAQGWSLLLFAHGVPFGIKDPLLGRDIGFYVFRLPLLQYLYDWLMGVLILTLALTAAVYLLRRSFFLIPPRTVRCLLYTSDAADE